MVASFLHLATQRRRRRVCPGDGGGCAAAAGGPVPLPRLYNPEGKASAGAGWGGEAAEREVGAACRRQIEWSILCSAIKLSFIYAFYCVYVL